MFYTSLDSPNPYKHTISVFLLALLLCCSIINLDSLPTCETAPQRTLAWELHDLLPNLVYSPLTSGSHFTEGRYPKPLDHVTR